MDHDCRSLDKPEVLRLLFHPRRETLVGNGSRNSNIHDVLIPVDDSVQVGGRFHLFNHSFVNMLFFHGNGEIVSDYDDLAPLYERIGVNFCPVDYRGYGRSSGTPSCAALIRDSHIVLNFVLDRLSEAGCTGPLVVMGRSLGSAPAIELAADSRHRIQGLIVESGFAHTLPLLRLLGIDVESLRLNEIETFGNHEKIRGVRMPTLIIHAALDQIIPFTEAKALYDACGAEKKSLLKMPDAGHNDIFYRGLTQYLSAIKTYVQELRSHLHCTGDDSSF
jgi:fermentation-respiration switch protein FrsA (DUF1100 family)